MDIKTQMSRFIVDPRENNRARVSNTATNLLNRLGVNNQRTGGMLFNSALGRLPKIAEATRNSLYLTTPEERSSSAISELPAQSQIERLNAIAGIYDQQQMPGKAEDARGQANALQRAESDRAFAEEMERRRVENSEAGTDISRDSLNERISNNDDTNEMTRERDLNNYNNTQFQQRMSLANLQLGQDRFDETVNNNVVTNANAAARTDLSARQFEQALLMDEFSRNMQSANFALSTNDYMLRVANAEATANQKASSTEFLRLSALAETDPIVNRIFHNAAETDLPVSEALSMVRMYQEDSAVQTVREQNITVMASSLMQAKDEDGNPAFTPEEARTIAEQEAAGVIEFSVTDSGLVDIINKPSSIAEAMSGNPSNGVVRIPTAIPEMDTQNLLNTGAGAWGKRHLINGLVNLGASKIQNFFGGLGLESIVNQEREQSLQDIRLASGIARDAFRDDGRMSNLDALQIAEEFGLGSDWFGSTSGWEARAVTVDRSLNNLSEEVKQEASLTSGARYDTLISQFNAINRLRKAINVPSYYHPQNLTEEMISVMTVQELNDVSQFYKNTGSPIFRNFELANPERAKQMEDKFTAVGATRKGE